MALLLLKRLSTSVQIDKGSRQLIIPGGETRCCNGKKGLYFVLVVEVVVDVEGLVARSEEETFLLKFGRRGKVDLCP